MKRISIILLCVSVSLFSFIGCNKDFPVPDDEVPVFTVKGTINGASVDIGAGNDGYYMLSSYAQDSISGVYKFLAALKRVTGATNKGVFEIDINDDSISASNAPIQINSLIPAYYTLEGSPGNATKFRADFVAEPDSNDTASSYNWDFGDGTTSTTGGPTVSHFYYHPGDYHVCLTINYTSGCSSNICNGLQLGMGNPFYNSTSFTDTIIGGVHYFSPVYSGSATSYSWSFGEGSASSSLSNPSFTYSNPNIIHKVCLLIQDANYPTAEKCRNVPSLNNAGCLTNFTNTVVGFSNILKLSTAVIRWTDNSGITYSSANGTQSPIDNYFEILSVEDYKTNEKGEPTKKLNVRFKCLLYNGLTSIPAEGTATIAISYK